MDGETTAFIKQIGELTDASKQAADSIGRPDEEDRLRDYNRISEGVFSNVTDVFSRRTMNTANGDAKMMFEELLGFVHSQLDLAKAVPKPCDELRDLVWSKALFFSKEAIIFITHRRSIHEEDWNTPDDTAKLEALERKAGQNPLNDDFAFRTALDILRMHIELFKPGRRRDSELNRSVSPGMKAQIR